MESKSNTTASGKAAGRCQPVKSFAEGPTEKPVSEFGPHRSPRCQRCWENTSQRLASEPCSCEVSHVRPQGPLRRRRGAGQKSASYGGRAPCTWMALSKKRQPCVLRKMNSPEHRAWLSSRAEMCSGEAGAGEQISHKNDLRGGRREDDSNGNLRKPTASTRSLTNRGCTQETGFPAPSP